MVNLIHPSSPATKELFNYLNDLSPSYGQVIPLVSRLYFMYRKHVSGIQKILQVVYFLFPQFKSAAPHPYYTPYEYSTTLPS